MISVNAFVKNMIWLNAYLYFGLYIRKNLWIIIEDNIVSHANLAQ